MTYMKISSLSVVLGLMTGVGVLPSAMAEIFELNGITNVDISCTAPLQNCQVKNVPQVSCDGDPSKVTTVTVSMGASVMDSSLAATNTGTFGACYNIKEIAHTALTLRVPTAGLELNGPGNSGGSGIDLTACNAGVDNPPWVYYRDAGQPLSVSNLLVSTKTQKVYSFDNTDAEFAVFVGNSTFVATFEAQANVDDPKSGTWQGGIVTNATSSLTVTPNCETPPPPPPDNVPAIGALGLGLLGLGLSGLGVMFGFRRRR